MSWKTIKRRIEDHAFTAELNGRRARFSLDCLPESYSEQ
jgi:hypothetical protein